MNANRVFVDTNIIVYSVDAVDEPRHSIAVERMRELWKSENGVLSTQVLQEFFVVSTTKIPRPLSQEDARRFVYRLSAWDVVVNNSDSILRAIDIQAEHGYSFWDCLILDAAIQGGAQVLLTEDFTHDRMINGVRVVNPFISPQ